MPGSNEPAPVPIAVVVGAHGVGGALRCRLHNPGSEALRPGAAVTVIFAEGSSAPACITSLRAVAPIPGRALLRVTVDACRDRTTAQSWVGATLAVERTALALAPDEFLVSDAIGLRVIDLGPAGADAPRMLGRVIGWTSNGAQDLLEIEDDEGDPWLLPLVPGVVVEVGEELSVRVPLGLGPAREEA